MARIILIVCLIGSAATSACTSQAQVPPPDEQIAAAVAPAPEDMQEEATVLGYDTEAPGELVTLREGTNELICLADDPEDDRFHVACYHESLEPFMERGRELRVQGLSREDVVSTRQDEIASGDLPMPDHPASLYSLTGGTDSFDPETGTVSSDASPLYVVYTPFATGDEVGLPTRPTGDMPWLMDAGKPWAHIMISPGASSN